MKKFILVCVTVSLIFALAACGNSKGKTADQSNVEEVEQFVGVLDEKKDFMIVASTEDGKNTYIFNLDGITCDCEIGDKIEITYTGDIEDFDAHLTAVEIKKVE